MDHRWDEHLRAENLRRIEQARYGSRRIDEDAEEETEAARRARILQNARRGNKSPWSIGASHWNQRDLYTRGSDPGDRGYALGPALHPEVGSYAYPRWAVAAHEHDSAPPSVRPSVYEREAWPWLNYDRFEQGPHGLRRADGMIHDEVCDALACDAFVDASKIAVGVEGAVVTLRGTIPSSAQKRVAGQLAARVHGVEDVHNRLVVRRDDDKPKSDGDDLTFAKPIATLA